MGAVLLAGGQGSRLGFEHPKGMFNMGRTRELYIFQCLIENLKRVTDEAQAYVPLLIMTSKQNNEETQAFFREHGYFGYSATTSISSRRKLSRRWMRTERFS